MVVDMEDVDAVISKLKSERARSRPVHQQEQAGDVLNEVWHRMSAYFDGDPAVESCWINVADLAIEIQSIRDRREELRQSSKQGKRE